MRPFRLILCLCCAFVTVPRSVAAADEIVVYASDITTIVGGWTRVSSTDAAGGQYLSSPDTGWSSVNVPLAAPPHYFEAAFSAPANTSYHVWFRLRAAANSKYNDSLWVQYSDGTKDGVPVYAIGSSSALLVNLENCAGCGHSGWGWKDGAYWLSQASTIQFSTTGAHRLRVQVREDGVQIDQIVLSPTQYLSAAPGQTTNDTTIVSKTVSAPPPPPATSTPYLGAPAAIPGTLRAENFDNGGAGVAYSDTTPGNSGNAYRATDVDVQPSSAGGFNVGWVAAGEWLNYTVNVAVAGTYTVSFSVASPAGGGRFHLEIKGTNVTGPLAAPSTGDWQSWQTVTATVSLAAGQQIARLVADAPGMNFGPFQFTSAQSPTPAPPPPPPPPPTGPTPYTGTPAAIPGRIEAVNFDNGGSGSGYSDTSPGNSGGAYRSTDVDIEASAGGGFNVGWTSPGEWLNYTVNVGSAGSYVVQLRVASPTGGSHLRLAFNAGNVSTGVSVPATGGWQAWTTVSVPVTLAAGVQHMKVLFDTGGFNLGPMTVSPPSAPPPPVPPPPAPPPTTTQASLGAWVTTRDGSLRLAQQSPVPFVAGDGTPSLPTIVVDETVRYQPIEGFGGSLTDSSAWVLSRLSPDRQAAILTALFDRNAGIGLNFLRQPIGSSDFARSLYTFDDIDPAGTDYGLANFSIDHDRAYILPVLRAALKVNPEIRVLASPWSAPAWMKTSRTITDGGSLRPEAFATYASYFVKFIQAYGAEGVPIDSITVQNEPLTAPPYPSMYMTSADQTTFIGQHLGPALARAGLKPRVFTWDHNWDATYPLAVLSNPTAASYIAGVAFHCYGGQPGAMSTVQQAYPQLPIWTTECADSSRVSFGEKITYDVRILLIGSLRNWARTVAKWNLVLDESGGPKLFAGSCRNCAGAITVDSVTGAVSYNEDYYALAHASRFIQRGAYRVDSTNFGFGGIENVAFINPDGSLVVLAINTAWNPLTFQIRSRGATVQYTLPSEAVATFKWTPR